jgi:hypothetical protein
MSVASLSKTQPIVGSLDGGKAQGFLAPLADLLKISGQRVVLRFNAADKNITVNAINDSRNVVSILEYDKSLLEGFTIPVDLAFGVFDLTEFYNLAKIFDGGFNLNVNVAEAKLENNGNEFSYLATEADVIKEGPKSLKGAINWVAEFKWQDGKFKSFVRAMSALKHKYVIFEGKAGSKELTVAISDKGVRSSSYKETIILEDALTANIKLHLNKENFVPIVTGSVDDLSIQLSDKLVSISGTSEYHKVKYYVSAIAE